MKDTEVPDPSVSYLTLSATSKSNHFIKMVCYRLINILTCHYSVSSFYQEE